MTKKRSVRNGRIGGTAGLDALVVAVAVVACLMAAGRAEATPLLAMQAAEKCDMCHQMPDPADPKWQEQNYTIWRRKCRLSCGVCHVNPTGGMLRNPTGFYFGTTRLPMIANVPASIQGYIDKIKTERFYIGGDFRFMSLYREDRDKNPTLFPMQGDLYLSANLLKHLDFMTQFGLERGGNSAVREVFGMINDFPGNAYLKAGKFLPPYGLRLEDHTAYIRTKLGFDHSKSDSYYSGVEVGAEPLVLFGKAAYFDADDTPATETDASRRGFSGILGWRGLWLHLGGSYMDIINYETSTALTVDRRAYGVFGALRAHGVPYLERLTYLFEFDRRVDTHIDSDGREEDFGSDVTFNELDCKLTKGLNLKLRYETYDPNDALEDEQDVERFVAGVDVYPTAYTEINIQYRHINEGDDQEEVNNDQVLLIAHIWF